MQIVTFLVYNIILYKNVPDIYPHKIALFSGGLSTRDTPTSSWVLFTPAGAKVVGETGGSEQGGELRGEEVGVRWLDCEAS